MIKSPGLSSEHCSDQFPTKDPGHKNLQEVIEEGFESAANDGTDFNSNLRDSVVL